MEKKYKRLIWVLVSLTLLNVTTQLTIYYQNKSERKRPQRNTKNISFDRQGNPMDGKRMIKNLDLNEEQLTYFKEQRERFGASAEKIVAGIEQQKSRMFEELSKPESDTILIAALSDSIGFFHSQLKKETAKFYLSMKKICSNEQYQCLEKVFVPLFGDMTTTGHKRQKQ